VGIACCCGFADGLPGASQSSRHAPAGDAKDTPMTRPSLFLPSAGLGPFVGSCGCSPFLSAFGRPSVSRRGFLCAAVGFAAIGGAGRALAQGAELGRLSPLAPPGRGFPADLILQNGPIHTMAGGAGPERAVAVGGGRILAVGSPDALSGLRGPRTRIVDLEGRSVVPGFIDAHGHISQLATVLGMADLQPPPAGGVASLADLGRELLAWRDRTGGGLQGWLLGNGYDDSLLAEQRMPTRDDLDAVSREQPIVIIHVSGHLAVVNSKALELAGITAETADPQGGVVRRRPGSREPDGVIEETALALLLTAMPTAPQDRQIAQFEDAQRRFAAWGFTSLQDGAVQPSDWANLAAAAAQGKIFLDVSAYPFYMHADALAASALPVGGAYDRGLRIGGLKLVLDGSPQGKTAWLTEPYLRPPPGQRPDYAGYPSMPDAEAERLVDLAFSRGWHVLAHCNGDAAGDQMIRAVEKATARHGAADRRPVMIHAQTAREDQLDAMQRLGIIPSFFINHVFYWGDWHRESVLGPGRAARISPAASALRRGMPFTLHADCPVVPGDAGTMLWCATERRTRSGQVLGDDQRITALDALAGITRVAAFQNREETVKGRILPGMLADLTVLEEDPLRSAPDRLRALPVSITLKAGRAVHGQV
jgi:predicted amidohydrolase YtcJ